MCQPRAKFGLSARARSTNAIMAPMSSPKYASARAAFARMPGSSPATSRARLAKSITLPAIRRRIFAPTVKKQPITADRSPGERGPVTRIALDRLLHQTERLGDLPCRRQEHRGGAQIEVVGGQIVGRSGGRTGGLGGLQCRLDHAGDARGHLVLKLEDIFERAVEPIGPQMRAGHRVDQLADNAHATAGLAHRAFEHVPNAEFAADLLHVDRLALVREARIAGDDEEPADAGERGDDLLDHAVGEIFLLRIAAQIGERAAPRSTACRGGRGPANYPHPPHASGVRHPLPHCGRGATPAR